MDIFEISLFIHSFFLSSFCTKPGNKRAMSDIFIGYICFKLSFIKETELVSRWKLGFRLGSALGSVIGTGFILGSCMYSTHVFHPWHFHESYKGRNHTRLEQRGRWSYLWTSKSIVTRKTSLTRASWGSREPCWSWWSRFSWRTLSNKAQTFFNLIKM